MKSRGVGILFALYLSVCADTLRAQGESAVPFLMIANDPAANGWGGVTTATIADNPMATMTNPAQLGIFSLDRYFSASMYVPQSDWLPSLQGDQLTYDARSLNAGVNLGDLLDIPVPLGIGFGYSRVDLDLGTFFVTSPQSPDVVGSYSAKEMTEGFSVGVGLDYAVRAGFGMNFKRIVSSLGSGQTPNSRLPGTAKSHATDFGVLVQIPALRILSSMTGSDYSVSSKVNSLLDINAGYALNNVGPEVVYSDVPTIDPLPRRATVGISIEAGFTMQVNDRPWKLLSFAIAREAEDLLIVRERNGGFGYQSGLGDIVFFKHVIGGTLDDTERPNLHKGWQINVGEAVYVRGGSFAESPYYGNRNYITSGLGLRLGGMLKFLVATRGGEPASGWFQETLVFAANHVDVGYDYAQYSTTGPLGQTEFSALSITIK
jgi:hypothetical protein